MNLFLVLFLAIFLAFFGYRNKKIETLENLEQSVSGEQFTVTKPKSKITVKSPLHYAKTLADQAGVKVSRTNLLTIIIVSPIFGGFLGLLLNLTKMAIFLCMCFCFALPFIYLFYKRTKYMNAFRYGLLDLTELGIAIFQAATDVDSLFHEGAKSKNKVIAYECKEILRESDVLGVTTLRIMIRRAEDSNIPEYRLLARMTSIAIDTNSSLVKVYQDMNKRIRSYFGTEKDVIAKTSGMRKVGYGLSLIPFFGYIYFWPSIQPYLHGMIAIAFYISVIVTIVGVFLLRRVVRVRV